MMNWWRRLFWMRRAGDPWMDRDDAPSPAFRPKKSLVQQRRVKVHSARVGFSTAFSESVEVGEGQRQRMVVAMFGLTLMFAGVATKLAFVALMPPAEPQASIREMPQEALRRGNIYDRNGVLVAATLQVYSVFADPRRVIDPAEVAEKIAKVVRGVDAVHLLSQLTDPSRRFIWIKRRLTPEDAAKVHAMGLPGVEFREEFVRVYPHQDLAGHLLGAVDVDNNGLAGVERAFDDKLRAGTDVRLGLDVRLQQLLKRRVADAMALSESKAGWGVVMKADTREIVALVSLPDFDPNHYGKATPDQRFNRVTLASYEMGSTFKIFTLAQGLIDRHITPDTLVDCRIPITIGRYTIKDYHAKKAVLTAREILRYSSNIGAAKIADMSGPVAQKAFMKALGMLEAVNVGVSEVGPVRYPANWGRVQTFTIAFGHGMMVTPIHLVTAVAALADGIYKKPSVLLGGAKDGVSHAVISDTRVLGQIHDLMRDVVVNGSGRPSQVAGYDIGGKTGTAEKISGRGYSKDKNIVSFVGVLPMAKPEYITLVMLDEPKKGYETGGRSAAPAVGAFYKDLTQVAGLPPVMQEVRDYKALLAKYKRKEEDVYSPYLLTDMRLKKGMAGGVDLKGVVDEEAHD